MDYYVKYQDIQDYLTDHYRRTGTKTDFVTAVKALWQGGKGVYTKAEPVDFFKWELSRPEDLRKVYADYYIYVTPILESPETFYQYVSEEYIDFCERDVIANVHFFHENAFAHEHDYFEVNYILSGEAEITCSAEERTLHTGDVCIIAPDTSHMIAVKDGGTAACLAVRRSTFETAFFHTLNNDTLMSAFFRRCLYSEEANYSIFHTQLTPELMSVLRTIFKESCSQQPYANEICCSTTGIFFSLILRLSGSSYFYSTKLDSAVADMPKVLNYIKLHYRDTTLTEVAEHFHYNSAYLGKQIKKATGMLYNDLVTHLKLQYAMTLLSYSEMKIEAIAEQVGYHSADHFSRTFKKATGLSPQQYRKANPAQRSEPMLGGGQRAYSGFRR